MPIYGYSLHPHSNVILHQTENKKMKPKTELPEELCADEAVCFIAYRHHVTPQQLLRYFLYGETSIPLEPNEVEILKGLSELIENNRIINIKRQ